MSYWSTSMGSGVKMQSGVDMPLLRTITNIVGQSIWFKAIVALNHVSFAPLEDPKDHEKSNGKTVETKVPKTVSKLQGSVGAVRLGAHIENMESRM
ncbi:hypothetical protein Tco_0584488 [Tanacetum coccineum]